jgi:hypothetical protein
VITVILTLAILAAWGLVMWMMADGVKDDA